MISGHVNDRVSLWAMSTPARLARRGYGRALLASVLAHARADGARLGMLGATARPAPLREHRVAHRRGLGGLHQRGVGPVRPLTVGPAAGVARWSIRYTLAVVTGAGDGLGREIAVALSRLGAAVVVADRDLAAAEGPSRAERGQGAGLGGAGGPRRRGRRTPAGRRARDLVAPTSWSTTRWLDRGRRSTRTRRTGVVANPGPQPARRCLTRLFLDDLDARRGRQQVVPSSTSGRARRRARRLRVARVRRREGRPGPADRAGGRRNARRARVMAVVPGWIGLPRARDSGRR